MIKGVIYAWLCEHAKNWDKWLLSQLAANTYIAMNTSSSRSLVYLLIRFDHSYFLSFGGDARYPVPAAFSTILQVHAFL